MLRLLVIDDSFCKKDLETFIKKNKSAVSYIFSGNGLNKFGGRETIKASRPERKIAINTTESITLINIGKIIRCESHKNYTFIHLPEEKKLIVSRTLMDIEKLLDSQNFLRIHKSHLVNINYMEKYVKSEGGYVLMSDGSKLPVAVRKKDYLFKRLEKL